MFLCNFTETAYNKIVIYCIIYLNLFMSAYEVLSVSHLKSMMVSLLKKQIKNK